MATQAYYNWLNAGSPYTLAEWMGDLVETMRGHGFTVYHYPDDDHLMAAYPQDHTPFSYTGWPLDSPWGWGFGVDVMPEPGADARSLAPLARQIIADKRAGLLPGLKYINWTDEQGNVWQTSWKPDEVTRSNTDKGHIHLSGRSDSAHWRAVGYDPIARLQGDIMAIDSDLILRATVDGMPTVKLSDGRDHVVCATAWQIDNSAKLDRLIASQAASAAREAAAIKAIEMLTAAITAGGGSVETAPIIAAIREVGSDVEQLHAQVAELTAENARLQAAMAALPDGVVSNLVAELTD